MENYSFLRFFKSRRMYERLTVNIPCTLYAVGDEFTGYLSNISEQGFLVIVDDTADVSHIQIKDKARIVFPFDIEEHEFMTEQYELNDFTGVVIRKSNNSLGCFVKDEDFEHFVSNLKVEDFIKNNRFHRKRKNK